MLHYEWLRRFFVVFVVMAGGCSSQPKPAPKPPVIKTLQVTHHLGGTHYRTLVHRDRWYQTFASWLLVLDPRTGARVAQVDFGAPGTIGPAIDLIARGDQVFVVIEDDEVIELSLENPDGPAIVNRTSASTLGIRPQRLSAADDQILASGPGGVVRIADLTRIFSSEADAGRVALTSHGLAICLGRAVHSIADNRYVGSATELIALSTDSSTETSTPAFAYIRQGENGALVGLMSFDVREIAGDKATTAVPGIVRSARFAAGKLWIVTDTAIAAYEIDQAGLRQVFRRDVLGTRDVGVFSDSTLAVAGSSGRAILKYDQTDQGQFMHTLREPSRLSRATTDGQHIAAGSAEGWWMYLINSRVEQTRRTFENLPPPSTSAAILGRQARIAEDGFTLRLTGESDPMEYHEPERCRLHCVAAVDGEFWLGHERGISVLKPQAPAPLDSTTARKNAAPPAPPTVEDLVVDRLRMPGPVLYIYPLLVGGGASFVSEFGGFGVAQYVEEPASSKTLESATK